MPSTLQSPGGSILASLLPTNTSTGGAMPASPFAQLAAHAGTNLASLVLPERTGLIGAAVGFGIIEGIRESRERAEKEQAAKEQRQKDEKVAKDLADTQKKEQEALAKRSLDQEHSRRVEAERRANTSDQERDTAYRHRDLYARRVQQIAPGLILPPPYPLTSSTVV